MRRSDHEGIEVVVEHDGVVDALDVGDVLALVQRAAVVAECEEREGARLLRGEVELQREVVEVDVAVVGIHQPQVAGQRGEAVANIEEVTGVVLL